MLRYALVLKQPPADARAQAEEAEHGTRIVETLEFAWQDRRWTFRGTVVALFTGQHDRLDLPVVDRTPVEGRACCGAGGPAWAGYSNQGQKKNQSAA